MNRGGCSIVLAWQAAAALLALASLQAAAQTPLEAGVKAAYLVKFLSYVEWPSMPIADAPLVIGVMGADAVHAELQTVAAGRQVGRRPLIVKRLQPSDPLVGELHLLYVGAAVAPGPRAQALQRRPVLLVTDNPDGLAAGGALNFMVNGGRVRFEAAPAAAEEAGLRLSARLLGVAQRVVVP